MRGLSYMAENENTEQWKINQAGDCKLCRRKTYCGKQCKNSKIFMRDYVIRVYKEELQKEMNKENSVE